MLTLSRLFPVLVDKRVRRDAKSSCVTHFNALPGLVSCACSAIQSRLNQVLCASSCLQHDSHSPSTPNSLHKSWGGNPARTTLEPERIQHSRVAQMRQSFELSSSMGVKQRLRQELSELQQQGESGRMAEG